MTFRPDRIAVCLAALGAVMILPPAHAQAPETEALVKRGRVVWMNRACAGCHGIGKKGAGPDLAGVTERRSREWLVRFLKETDQMLTTDSTAMALVKEWKGVKMPKPTVNDQDIEAVFAFIQSEEAKLKRKSN